jgi:hypothetical protein
MGLVPLVEQLFQHSVDLTSELTEAYPVLEFESTMQLNLVTAHLPPT